MKTHICEETCQLIAGEIYRLLTVPPHSPRLCTLRLLRPSLDNAQSVASEVHIWPSSCIRHGLLGATVEKNMSGEKEQVV